MDHADFYLTETQIADLNAFVVPDILRAAALEGNLAATMAEFRDEGVTEGDLMAALAAAGLTQDDLTT